MVKKSRGRPPKQGAVKKEDVMSIRVSRETTEELRGIGQMGETYNDVIERLINYYKEK
jgi:hypothetical protein